MSRLDSGGGDGTDAHVGGSASLDGGPRDAQGPVQVPEPSEKAIRYHRGGTAIWVVNQLVGVALPTLLLLTGLSAALRTWAAQLAHGHFYPTLVIYLAALSLLLFIIQLPLNHRIDFAREHAYGLSTQRLAKWVGDQLKGLAIGIVVGALVLWIPYLLLARSPERWWLWTGALGLPFFALTLLIGPIWIAPLFSKFGPLRDRSLEEDVLEVAERAGVQGARVFQVDKSVETKKVNAYVTGVGNTKRIVLWDTLLARLSPRQTRFVVAHEVGHYVLGHVWRSVLLSSIVTVLALFGIHSVAAWVLNRFGDLIGFHRLDDVASMPLFMLLLSLFSFLITPAMLAFSRYHEREADRFGLELTRDNHAAATAFVALQEQNLAVPRPGRLFTIFRASHPPIGARVDFINEYRPWASGRAGRYADRFQSPR